MSLLPRRTVLLPFDVVVGAVVVVLIIAVRLAPALSSHTPSKIVVPCFLVPPFRLCDADSCFDAEDDDDDDVLGVSRLSLATARSRSRSRPSARGCASNAWSSPHGCRRCEIFRRGAGRPERHELCPTGTMTTTAAAAAAAGAVPPSLLQGMRRRRRRRWQQQEQQKKQRLTWPQPRPSIPIGGLCVGWSCTNGGSDLRLVSVAAAATADESSESGDGEEEVDDASLSSSSWVSRGGGREAVDASDSVSEGKSIITTAAAAATAAGAIRKFRSFAEKNFFLVGMAVAVTIAKAFPMLGTNGGTLRPELFVGQYGVACIFLLSGLSLQLSDLADAATNMKLNGLVQAAIFGAWPALVGVPLCHILRLYVPDLLPTPVTDGLLVLTCLPTTVNMCVILTSACGGNVASALCNAVLSNVLGIFATPALLLRFFGESIALPFGGMILKLCNKVLLPVAVGQALRATPAKDLYNRNSKKFKRLQEIILLGIVWNAFCNAFARGMGLELRHGIALLTILPIMHLASLLGLFAFFRTKFLRLTRGDVVAGTFCSSQKTLAFGLPLINTIFEGNPNLAAYCAPIMFVHPLQLVLGSICLPFFTRYIEEGGGREEDE